RGRGGRGRGRGRGNSVVPVRFDDPQTPPKSWAVFCFEDYWKISMKEEDLKQFTQNMTKEAEKFGMIFQAPKTVEITLIQDLDDVTLFFEDLFLERTNLELIFIGIPSGKWTYCGGKVNFKLTFKLSQNLRRFQIPTIFTNILNTT